MSYKDHPSGEAAPLRTSSRNSFDSDSSSSTASLVLEQFDGTSITEKTRLTNGNGHPDGNTHRRGVSNGKSEMEEFDLEEADYMARRTVGMDRRTRRTLWLLAAVFAAAWGIALLVYLSGTPWSAPIPEEQSPAETTKRAGKEITLDMVLQGKFRARKQAISWIEGPKGEDGLLLERGGSGKAYLVVEDVRSGSKKSSAILGSPDVAAKSITLMQQSIFFWQGQMIQPAEIYPSKDLKVLLIASDKEKNFRHSFFANYWLFDVAAQTGLPLEPSNPDARIQLATFSPASDAVVYTKDNNLFLRRLADPQILQITADGGPNLFYGVPDWVYEEEVFSGRSATWWSDDGKYIAYLRTDESNVPDYEIQFFIARPSGKQPKPGLENYPEIEKIKYPKAGAPNPIVTLHFFDAQKNEAFTVPIEGDFADDDRLITEVVWAGSKVIVRETNRISTVLKVVLIDVASRTGRVVREQDVYALDGGWLEVSQTTRFIPADSSKGRPADGYIDTIIHEGYDHIGYFSPLDNATALPLTSGKWEVVDAPSAVDLDKNVVYFVAARNAPSQRHVYSVKLDGSEFKTFTNDSQPATYDVSFSKGASFALLSYNGPSIPWQSVVSTPASGKNYNDTIETNDALADIVRLYALPHKEIGTINIDGVDLQYEELKPPDFDPKKKYPVLFHVYGGPGSQLVSRAFSVDFEAYIAATLGYVVVTLDGRGTGNNGRAARVLVRDKLGHWESHDQIAGGKYWAEKSYVDAKKMAIWGWSYGGYMTLKTLEQDAGQTFKYGMAVAPVTDWRLYDSIYTERYMSLPTTNAGGYEASTVNNVTALGQSVRWLLMHGVADDNVHLQNSLRLLDKLDVEDVENFDMAVFPDSDHSIYFHGANKVVYQRLSNWLINAFNGEWERLEKPVPNKIEKRSVWDKVEILE